jgi:DNA-binding response OmpR family regulator
MASSAMGMGTGTAVQALVVEDDEGNRLLLSRYLAKEGFEVEAVGDGPAALQALTVRQPDVVVLDLGLPGLDGLEVLRRIRRDSGVPVLVLTGRDDEGAKLVGFETGADD